jgi:geranylgeranylglycerol-phosphate geranylgeranyltransferase
MFAYLEMLRPLNCLMTAFAVLIGSLLAAGMQALYSVPVFIAMAAGFIIAGYGNVINDYVDVEADKLNKPKRPIPSGMVSKKAAKLYAILLVISGLGLSYFVNPLVFAIAAFNSLLLYIYTFHWKYKVILGNLAISYMVGSAFLFGGAVFASILVPLVLTLLATLANLSREIAKVMEDVEGDKKAFLSIKMNDKNAKSKVERFEIDEKGNVNAKFRNMLIKAGTLSLIIAVLISPLPYLTGVLGLAYLVALIPANGLFLFSAYRLMKAEKKRHYAFVSKLIKAGMLFGLLAFITGILF